MKKTTFLMILALVIFSCNNNKPFSLEKEYDIKPENNYADMESRVQHPPQAESQGAGEVSTSSYKTKVIKDGQMGIKVSDLEKAKTMTDSLVSKYNGYYSNESLMNYEKESSYNLKIRIPSKNLDNFILALESGKGQILYKNIDVRDVTEEFIDLETRLENKRNYLKRYNDLLKQAKTVKDILEIEEKTRVIEEEIESAEGRLRYLSDLVDFSTLELRLTREKDYKFTPSDKINFFERLKQSFSNGWHGFVEFLLLLLKLWPFWIIIIISIPLWRRYKTRKRSKIV